MSIPPSHNTPQFRRREGTSSAPGPSRRLPQHSTSSAGPSDEWVEYEDDAGADNFTKTSGKSPSRPSGRDSPSSSVASSPSRRKVHSPRAAKSRPYSRNSAPSRSSQRQNQPVPTPVIKQPPSIPLTETLNLLLLPIRLLLTPFNILLAPIFAHLANGLLLLIIGSLAFYYLLPILPSIILKLVGKAIKYLSNDFITRSFGIAQDSDINLGKEVFLLPAKTLATPACLLAGLFCQTSLFAHKDEDGSSIPAKPFWASISGHKEDDVDVGQYARALTKEARGARDIFESIMSLGQGAVTGGLDHIRIWELAVTVNTGSTLDGKGFIAEQLRELGDMTRDLSDEIVHIDSKTVNAFSWLQWEFRDLVSLLSQPPSKRPSSAVISRKLHSLLLRLSTELDSIYTLTSTAAQHASQASVHGQGLDTELSHTASGLQYEKDRSPGWKRVYDKSSHFLVGGEPSKSELIDRDLKITTKTIGNIRALSRNLEETRIKVKVYRDQIGMFSSSMMGFHLGSNEDDNGIGPEEEVRVLNDVVEGLARSVGMAKHDAWSGTGTGKVDVLEIDQ